MNPPPLNARLGHDGIYLTSAYHVETRDALRRLRVRRWDVDAKCWVVPAALPSFDELVATFGDRLVPTEELATWAKNERVLHDLILAVKARGDGDIDGYTFLTPPWAHQRAAVELARPRGGLALFWEMGTGKTKAAIDICRAKNLASVLVVAPNEVTYNWKREVKLHAGEDALILEGPIREREEHLRKGHLPRYTVVNVESVALLHKAIARRSFAGVIVDESTRFKNPEAARTKALFAIDAPFKMVMSGTPITQHLMDIYAPISYLVPGIFGNYSSFKWRYFKKEWDAKRNRDVLVPDPKRIPELMEILNSLSYIAKKETLLDLPPKLPVQYLDVTMHGDQLHAYAEMRRTFKVWFSTLTGDIQTKAPIVLTQMMRLAQITSGFIVDEKTGAVHWFPDHAKSVVIDDLVSDLMPGKVVIFSHWRHECEYYRSRYEEHGSALIYGGMEPRDRDAIVNAFQTEDTPRVLVCQEGSGGIGINLTAAHVAIYASRSWSLEQWQQSQDRLHRGGQKHPVSIYVVQARGSVDYRVDEVLSGKKAIADIVMNGREIE